MKREKAGPKDNKAIKQEVNLHFMIVPNLQGVQIMWGKTKKHLVGRLNKNVFLIRKFISRNWSNNNQFFYFISFHIKLAPYSLKQPFFGLKVFHTNHEM